MAKILLSCHQFFPRFYTGTEVLVLEVADELARRGHEVNILTVEPILPGDEIPKSPRIVRDEYMGHNLWKLYVPPNHNPIVRLETENYEYDLKPLYSEVLDTVKPDLAHIFHLMRLTASFTDELVQRGIPVFFTATDYWLVCPTYQLIQTNQTLCQGPEPHRCFACLTGLYVKGMAKVPLHFTIATKYPQMASFANKQAAHSQALLNRRIHIHQRVAKQMDGLFMTNLFMQEMMHRNSIFGKKEFIQEFPIPIRAERIREIASVRDDGPLKVAFIGTLRASKGPQVLLDACKELGNREDLEVQIWGAAEDPTFEQELRRKAEGLENVRFCGTFKQEEFPTVLEDVHIVVIPSTWYENTPLTALTALAGKRLLIVSDLGGLSGLIKHGENGFTFPPGDAHQLAELLRMLAADREKVIQMASKAPEPLTVVQYVDNLIEVYADSISVGTL